MLVGFDYGSANCSVGMLVNDKVELLPLSNDSKYLPSTLYAFDRDLIAEAVYKQLPDDQKLEYASLRSAQLERARQVRHELDLMPDEQTVFVGKAAQAQYLDMPEEGFYVRSPKSFLGAIGLRTEQIALFEDIVTLMMQFVKQTIDPLLAKQQLSPASHAVIGRPVNFQGIGGEESNRQAEAILTLAAKRAGFVNVSFLFEPLAAGMDFETSLQTDKTVLVVDVGGGTTDCSVVKMGPERGKLSQRQQDFYGHSGQRIGGNDLDIALAMQGFMPLLGAGSLLKNGKPLPNQPFWNAVAVNDISAQREFSSLATKKLLEDLMKDAGEPDKLRRLQKVQTDQLGYQLVRQAEIAKIALSDKPATDVNLSMVEADFSANVTFDLFAHAISNSLDKVDNLMRQAMAQAQSHDETLTQPDIVYVTGGTARSPAIYQKIAQVYPQAQVVVGDHFGSVTAGLTKWAQKVFN
ncbi:molecular chaperone [Shewanella intestini]|uniref:Molecular chaperone n=1 Tax=Shewanella intestini TaxID=2017544 RepID=A0ABS5I4T4_9GAMM|nr:MULTISPECIES: molecular chaperone [Shewanella]MBR9729037.1 molecular chaperone [Shewanella intestini]MRG36897.1 molecular chaperone [Shewanella sp. XMDDZSB0408]